MNILLETIEKLPETAALKQAIAKGRLPCSLARVAAGARQHLAKSISGGRDVLFVCATEYEARQRFSEYIYGNKILLPAPQTELRPVETRGEELAGERIRALCQMQKGGSVVFLSMDSLLFSMRPAAEFYGRFLRLAPGRVFPPEKLAEALVALGYEGCAMVEGPGQVSGRGEIMEVFPPDAKAPYRITFFDDEVESIRSFDTDSQRSFGAGEAQICIPPAAEFCLDGEARQALERYLGGHGGEGVESFRARYLFELSERGTFANIEAYAGLLPGKTSVLEYAKNPLLLFDGSVRILEEQKKRMESRAAMLQEILVDGGAFGCEAQAWADAEDFLEQNKARCLDLEDIRQNKLLAEQTLDFAMRSTVGFGGSLERLAQAAKTRAEAGWQVYLMAGGRAAKLSESLAELGVLAPVASEAGASITCVPLMVEEGLEISGAKQVFFSEMDIFGAKARGKAKRQKKKTAPTLLADLRAGDLVVHEVHGKGRYNGLKTMEVGGASAEYMEIEYRDGDKLYIPTAQIGRVDKYVGPEEGTPRLNKLGGKEWESAKAKARSSVKELAEDLVAIYRERGVRAGYRFSPDTVWQRQFEDNFGYTETPGQMESIEQIKRDMESSKIMDRLLLGDVGYGKTEVAMRACFKACMDSKQVAVLVPTTLLARQHFATFKERFQGFPVRIEMLSRFTKHPKTLLDNLATGRTDIVIGTHKLLSKTVHFKNLGLLVIDEEQRFGVSHKERIKDFKRDVDVLTLTATPIPRTLEMAMTGIRDMSTIDTPPEDRKEVQAYVVGFDWGLVRDAVTKELARGGQVYFVCRRIEQMDALAAGLKRAVPEARVVMAHGQMGEQEFEAAVTSFVEREYDILLCTTIVESGIDIPAVNTIIVYEADKFGLAQLYQLKGRVGRSRLRAYAYFTYLGGEVLNETAAKRLEAIREFTQFGSGMKIAMRDLEIRGAGNVLGAEQSGHMAGVGYSLYCKMVKEEVASAMGQPLPRENETSVELSENAFIPSGYISDEGLKLDMYRRVAEADTLEKARSVREEFADRFGPLPKEVENLLGASVIRGFAGRAGIASVVRGRDSIVLRFDPNSAVDLRKLSALCAGNSRLMLRRSTPPAVVFQLKGAGGYRQLLQVLEQIRHCISARNQV